MLSKFALLQVSGYNFECGADDEGMFIRIMGYADGLYEVLNLVFIQLRSVTID